MAVVEHDLSDSGMLTPREIELEIEHRCRKWLGLSLAEFKQRHAAGTLPDTPAVDHIVMLLGIGA